jgi:hypothetical protein
MIKKYTLIVLSLFSNIALLASHGDFTNHENFDKEKTEIEALKENLADKRNSLESFRRILDGARKTANHPPIDGIYVDEDRKLVFEREVEGLTSSVGLLEQEVSDLQREISTRTTTLNLRKKSSNGSGLSTPTTSTQKIPAFSRQSSHDMDLKEKARTLTVAGAGHIRKRSSGLDSGASTPTTSTSRMISKGAQAFSRSFNHDDDDDDQSRQTSSSAAPSPHTTPHKHPVSEEKLSEDAQPLYPPLPFDSEQNSSTKNNHSDKAAKKEKKHG